MDIQKYIESGVLEAYCLGHLNEEDQAFLIQMSMLYPEVKEELTAIEQAMERLASASAVEPVISNKDKILAKLGFAEPAFALNLEQLPPIDKESDLEAWLNALKHMIPDEPAEDFSCNVIRKDEHLQQMLVITKTDVAEEEHGDYIESFFILRGKCECTVGNSRFKLGAGDFLEIPVHVKHDIKALSPIIVAVLQYNFV